MIHRKPIYILMLVVPLCLFARAQEQPRFDDYFYNRTLSLYLYREGNSHWDTVYLSDRGYARSGYVPNNAVMPGENPYGDAGWAGSTTVLLDPFDYGAYRVLVRDSATGREIYSRTYSTLFNEYRDTPEGRDSVARFEEVVRVPLPVRAVDICLQKRDGDRRFRTATTLHHSGGGGEVTYGLRPDHRPIHLQVRGSSHEKIDVAVVAEGYGAGDSAKMRRDFARFVEYLFSAEPFKGRRDDFNVWGLGVLAQESGITDPARGTRVNSVAGCAYNTFGSDRYLMTFHLFQLHDALLAVPYDHIVIMANSDHYGGGAIYNFYAVSAVQEMSRHILPHELGHSVGGLADEYVDEGISYGEIHRIPYEPTEPNITNMVDFDSKWKDLVDASTPVPTPPCTLDNPMGVCGPVGLYEGAGYSPRGVYRPVMNCMMRYYAPFCPVCERALNAVFDIYCK